MKILKIHGCSGAGKTTAVREFMKLCSIVTPIPGVPKQKVEAYHCTMGAFGPIYVLGSYENVCGGMDTVGTAERVMHMVDEYAAKGHVIFEGLLQSTYYGKMGQHSLSYGKDYIYAFLDTPIEVCLMRIMERRAASGRDNKFDPQLTRDKHRTIQRLQDRLEAQGDHTVVTIDYAGDVGRQVAELLNEAR